MYDDEEFDNPNQFSKSNEKRKKFSNLMISPMRSDQFDYNTTNNSYAEVMLAKEYELKKQTVIEEIKANILVNGPPKKKNRWDTQKDVQEISVPTPKANMWDETPGRIQNTEAQINQWSETPMSVSHNRDGVVATPSVRARYDETPCSVLSEELVSEMSSTSIKHDTAIGGDMSVRHDLSSPSPFTGRTPQTASRKRSRWDETPLPSPLHGDGVMLNKSGLSIRGTPAGAGASVLSSVSFTPGGVTPTGARAMHLSTPIGTASRQDPTGLGTPSQVETHRSALRLLTEPRERSSCHLTNNDLDEMLPQAGFRIVQVPANYRGNSGHAANRSAKKITATPSPMVHAGGLGPGIFEMHSVTGAELAAGGLNQYMLGMTSPIGSDIPVKREDLANFQLVFETEDGDESRLSAADKKKREIMGLVLRIKNGMANERRSAMREITKRAQEFGPQALFEVVLQPLISQTLEDQERHLLVKLLDRLLYKLADKVGPYVHKILVVMMPFLIEEDRVARLEGREVISNLSKAAGLPAMISALRPDIDNADEAVRKVTACALSVVAHSLGLEQLLPFLKAVCVSRKSWQARHTGVRVVQQVALTMRCSVLPFLPSLVALVQHGLDDEQQQVRTATALAIAALAEAACPYGIEAFDGVLKPLWRGIQQHRGKNLAAFLKAVGQLFPLMDDGYGSYGSYYFKEVMLVVSRELSSPDENMKLIVLGVIRRGCASSGIDKQYVDEAILPALLNAFWNARTALNRTVVPAVVDTLVEVARKSGSAALLTQLVTALKDESEMHRKMALDTVDRVLADQDECRDAVGGGGGADGARHNPFNNEDVGNGDGDRGRDGDDEEGGRDDMDEDRDGDGDGGQQKGATAATMSAARLEAIAGWLDDRSVERLVDGLVFVCEQQTIDANAASTMASFGSVLRRLGGRARPYVGMLCDRAQYRMQHSSDKVRLQAAEMIARIAPVAQRCQETGRLRWLCQTMYEYLGEEYPLVLAAILRALTALVRAVGAQSVLPPVQELLPRLTPILKNRAVHESSITLVGLLAEQAPDQVSPREWMRVCFELIEILKSPDKPVRRAAINTFGYIAHAVGPSDVLAVLLNNLKVQERQNRICSTVAIAVVADMCQPFTVLPAVMNEYRTPDINVQNGVLKSLSFMFEYVGDVVKDYIYAVSPLLEEALIERDIVHRQTAISAVGHLALGVYGHDCEDALIHLLNCVWPNMLETSPHIHQAFMQSIDSLRVSLGAAAMLPYLVQGLYHPARAVRRVCWKVYNTLYIGNPDGLVAAYPRIDDDDAHRYTRYMLQYKI